MRSGRRSSPEGTRLLFAGTISPMTYPYDRLTEGRQYKTTRNTGQEQEEEKGADTQS